MQPKKKKQFCYQPKCKGEKGNVTKNHCNTENRDQKIEYLPKMDEIGGVLGITEPLCAELFGHRKLSFGLAARMTQSLCFTSFLVLVVPEMAMLSGQTPENEREGKEDERFVEKRSESASEESR